MDEVTEVFNLNDLLGLQSYLTHQHRLVLQEEFDGFLHAMLGEGLHDLLRDRNCIHVFQTVLDGCDISFTNSG